MTLSLEQQRAVERMGQDVCVVAGPGSGKTRVLTERFAWLVEARNADPSRILAITFTEKAAIEIKARLVKRFAEQPERREAVERAWVSTIHGFCARLLRENAIAAGLPPDFTVLEQAPAERMQRESAEAALDELFAERPSEMRRLMEAIDLATSDDGRQDDLAAALIRVYEAMRTSGVQELPEPTWSGDVLPEARELARSVLKTTWSEWASRFLALPEGMPGPEHLSVLAEFTPNLRSFSKQPQVKRLRDEVKPRLEAQWLGAMNAGLHDLLRLAVERIDRAYRARKRSEAVVDFSDLEELSVRLLASNPEILRTTRERFDEVLMDELQDTNRVQWRLVELVKQRLFAVGDINQSIYGFRYADPGVFSEFRDRLRAAGGEIDELRDNYRSRPEILAAVADVLQGAAGIEPRELNAKGAFSPASGAVVERFLAAGDDPVAIEAAMVAARIQEWRSARKFEYKDIALLVRTFAAAEAFEEAFDRAGIPFIVSGGRGFMEARETRDLLALLAALVNVSDEIPLIGVLRGPLVGLSDEEIYRIGRDGWRRAFEQRFGWVRQMAGFLPPDRLIAKALDECGYWSKLHGRARANVEKLLAWIRREFRNRPRALAELLEDLETLRDARSTSDAPPPEAGNVVRIMTIHGAKGLEFPAVFVCALHSKTDQHSPALLFSAEHGMGVKWRNPVTGKGVSDSIHAFLKENERDREERESDRLLYVAMTRAERHLVLTHSDRRQKSRWEKAAMAGIPGVIQMSEAPSVARAGEQEEEAAELLWKPPAVAGQYDSTASITSVALFTACPRKYYLSRYLGLEPEPQGAGTGAIAMGLAVHAALAGEPQSPEAQALAENFLKSEWGQRTARAGRVAREFDFMLELSDIVLRGQIDLWFEEAGELVVIDYKTDRVESPSADYALQLRLYAIALERYAGRIPERAILFYVRSGKAIDIDLSAESLRQARESVAALRASQEQQSFPLRPGDQCQRCSFWSGLCPEGKGEGVRSGQVFGPPSSFLAPASSGS